MFSKGVFSAAGSDWNWTRSPRESNSWVYLPKYSDNYFSNGVTRSVTSHYLTVATDNLAVIPGPLNNVNRPGEWEGMLDHRAIMFLEGPWCWFIKNSCRRIVRLLWLLPNPTACRRGCLQRKSETGVGRGMSIKILGGTIIFYDEHRILPGKAVFLSINMRFCKIENIVAKNHTLLKTLRVQPLISADLSTLSVRHFSCI